jgi:serine/threonine protein kinase
MQGLRQPVAVKMGVLAGATPTLAREEALQIEARLLHLLQHPHIVSVLGVVTRTQPTFLCLEYMVNGDLKTYLR